MEVTGFRYLVLLKISSTPVSESFFFLRGWHWKRYIISEKQNKLKHLVQSLPSILVRYLKHWFVFCQKNADVILCKACPIVNEILYFTTLKKMAEQSVCTAGSCFMWFLPCLASIIPAENHEFTVSCTCNKSINLLIVTLTTRIISGCHLIWLMTLSLFIDRNDLFK